MALRLSTGLRDFLLESGSLKQAFQGGNIKIYSGAQPASADNAPSGTLLVTITEASGALTAEILSQGSVTLTGGASGSVDGITVNGVEIMSGAEAFDTSLTVTATNVAANINDNISFPNYTASSSGAVVTITAMPGSGTVPNGDAVVASTTTITTTDVNMGTTTAGVASANGLDWGDAANGQLVKDSAVWSGVAGNTGTAGWFRLESTIADNDSSSTTLIRLDGNVGVSGANMNMSSTAIVSAATQTIDTFAVTVIAS